MADTTTVTTGIENGHCSTCQVQNSQSVCKGTAQAFKTVVGSTMVSDNEKYLKLNLDTVLNVTQGQTLVTKEIWDQVQNILQYIKDYGQIDENNPSQDKIDKVKVEQKQIAWINNYNDILMALDKNQIDGKQLITKQTIDNLKGYINNYNFDETRCDVCNAKGCQVSQGIRGRSTGAGGDPCYGGYDNRRYMCYREGGYGGYQLPSASLYKENIQNYTQEAIKLINSINIVKFNYKNDPEKNQKIGFIADNTDAQLATKNHDVMDVYNCIGILLKAVQELSTEIEKIKQEQNKNA